MQLSIRWKLILSISIPLLLTYLGMLGWDYWRQRDAAMKQMQDLVTERAQNTAAHLDTRLASIMQSAESLASALENRPNLTEQQVRALLLATLRQNTWIAVTAIALEPDAPPTTIPRTLLARRSSTGPSVIEPKSDEQLIARSWYTTPKETHTAGWSDPYDEAAESPRRICTFSVPLMVNDTFRGVVATSVYVEELRMLRRPERGTRQAQTEPSSALEITPHPLGAGTESFAILDGQGRLISSANPRPNERRSVFDLARDMNNQELAAAAKDALAGHSGILRVAELHNIFPGVEPDRHHWIALAPIPATGWIFAAAIPESAVMNPILRRLWQRAAFLAAGLAILLAVVLLVSIRISRLIERLAGAVDRLAAGDLDAQVTGVRGRDELGRLADGFNHMTRELKAHVKALTEQTAAREKVESELRIARKIQTDLLPRNFPPFPDRKEFELHATNIPAAGVAGDFFDFFFATPDRLTIVVADVSGKGVPAAILMAVTRTIVRNLAETGLSPAEIVRRANTMLIADTRASMFVTMFLCQYEPATGHIVYVNAGHPLPMRCSPEQLARPFGEITAPLIGVTCDAEIGVIEERHERLDVGQTLIVYTDGVTEARNAAGNMLRETGLRALVDPIRNKTCEELCQFLNQAVETFEGSRRTDDLTLLVLRRLA